MAGTRLRCILHDGSRMVDNRSIPRQFSEMRVADLTKSIYRTESKRYDRLGEEITAIEGVRKDDKKKTGFQVYLAVIKGGEVIEMGLPYVEGATEKKFLNASNLRLKDLTKLTGHLPEDFEIAIVWRLDKNMTQDIMVTENSLLRSVSPPSGNDFSLLDRKPCVGCGGGLNEDVELVSDITEVSIYCGEREDPIRMSLIVTALPSQALHDAPDLSFQFQRPPAVPPRNAGACEVSEFTIHLCWQDCTNRQEQQLILPEPCDRYAIPPAEKATWAPARAYSAPAIYPPVASCLQNREAPSLPRSQAPAPAMKFRSPINPSEERILEVIYDIKKPGMVKTGSPAVIIQPGRRHPPGIFLDKPILEDCRLPQIRTNVQKPNAPVLMTQESEPPPIPKKISRPSSRTRAPDFNPEPRRPKEKSRKFSIETPHPIVEKQRPESRARKTKVWQENRPHDQGQLPTKPSTKQTPSGPPEKSKKSKSQEKKRKPPGSKPPVLHPAPTNIPVTLTRRVPKTKKGPNRYFLNEMLGLHAGKRKVKSRRGRARAGNSG